MTIKNRCALAGVGFVVVLISGSVSIPAQEPDAAPVAVARRVPPYFGQIGITPDQRQRIYSIQSKYGLKIAELKKQLEEVQRQQLVECESVLTPSQKQLLNQLRDARKTASKRTTAPARDSDSSAEK